MADVDKWNPKFEGTVGTALSKSFAFPNELGGATLYEDDWEQLPVFPDGIDLTSVSFVGSPATNGTGTISGTPTKAGTFQLEFKYFDTSVSGTATDEGNIQDKFIETWLVTAIIHAAEDDDSVGGSACFSFNGGYTIKSIETSTQVYSLGSGISGTTITNLVENLNTFFESADYPLTAQVSSGQLWITVTDGGSMVEITLGNENTVNTTAIVSPTSQETNNEFFGKETEGSETEEYSYYTLIKTGAC